MSALIRGEFLLIQTAFDHMPSIETTGVFTTTFNQQGNYTFTLPSTPGTLAMLSDVATETARAQTAEAALAISSGSGSTSLGAAIAAETTRATAAEGVNATAITTEATARAAGDATNAAAVTTEATARTAAIGVETTRAEAAEATNATNIATNATAIAAETTRAEAAEALAAPLSGFASSFTSTGGYVKRPDGYIRQFGFGVADGTGLAVITYPIPFPTASHSRGATIIVSGFGSAIMAQIGASGLSTMNVLTVSPASGAGVGSGQFYWWAEGN